jgi:DNA-binding NarL/FixJ family response regulator
MIKIILIDDHAVVRTGYRRLLSAEPDFEVIGEAANGSEANALLHTLQPDVALVDLSLKGSSGLETIRSILARQKGLRVLVLSMHDSAGHVAQSLKSGAHGYLTKHSEPEEVIAGIRSVVTGSRVFSSDIVHLVGHEPAEPEQAIQNLTPREFEVLRLLVHGESAHDIAKSMHLSTKTVLNYLTLIRQKLDADNDFKLMHLAARLGVVEFGAVALN